MKQKGISKCALFYKMPEIRRKIVDVDLNDKILKMVSSRLARKIIEITTHRSLSASEISEMGNIPLTKVYRWLQKLEDYKLLRVTKIINHEGRKVSFYKSMIDMIMVNPNKKPSLGIEILGVGNIINCSKCESTNCTLEYDKKSKMTVCKCIDCETRYLETFSHDLKEEKQKIIILKALSNPHQVAEESQKVIILKGLLDEGKNKSKL